MRRLNRQSLAGLPSHVAIPRYDRDALWNGIVHFGIGAFMRAHLAVATERVIESGDFRWGIVGVSLRQTNTRDALVAQDSLYSVVVRDADDTGNPRQQIHVIGAVQKVLVATEDPAAVLDTIANEDTRIVSLTVTEKGYCHDPATGQLRLDHPDIAHDLVSQHEPRTVIGYIVYGLRQRFANGYGPLTLMSLDNLPSNGHVLRSAVIKFADQVDSDLAKKIASECSFPCSMVDRIVPKTTEQDKKSLSSSIGVLDAWPVLCEPFFDWAVEDLFVAQRPNWNLAGARFVDDAEPFEKLKLRMVNGAHSNIAYLGAMAGWDTVDLALKQSPLFQHIDLLMRDEILPSMDQMLGVDFDKYRTELLTRFSNPALAHRTHQIAMDGSQKLPQRLLGTIRDRLNAGQKFPRLALGVAAWMYYLRGVDELDNSFTIDDPHADHLKALYAQSLATKQDHESVRTMVSYAPVFGDLVGNETLSEALTPFVRSLHQQGVLATLRDLNRGVFAQC